MHPVTVEILKLTYSAHTRTHTLSVTDPLKASCDLVLSALLCNVQDLPAGHEPDVNLTLQPVVV